MKYVIHIVMKQLNNKQYARMFKALSNEQRLKLFLMIYNHCKKGEKCDGLKGMERAFTKACCCMSITRSTISHHFKELQNAGLIRSERMGQTFNCYVNPDAIKAIKQFLK